MQKSQHHFFHNNDIKRRRRYLWWFFWESVQTRHRETLEDPKWGGALKLQVIHLKSRVKPMVMIGVCILFTINKFVMISLSCRQRTDDWRWPLGLLAVTSGYTHAARSIPTQTQPGRTETHKCTNTNPDTHSHTYTHIQEKHIQRRTLHTHPDSA